MKRVVSLGLLFLAVLALGACGPFSTGATAVSGSASIEPSVALVGAWRARVQFADGAFADVRDLEFMYVFNAGGTMTESSNYDGAPPVPPAYGAWRQTAPRVFESRYEFFVTKPPAAIADIVNGGGWAPTGSGTLTERYVLSADARSFESTLELRLFDAAGIEVQGGGRATARGARIAP